MPGTPTSVVAPLRDRPSPVDTKSLEELLEFHHSGARTPSPYVLARDFKEEGDESVFGAAFAIQIEENESWLVRGVLRAVAGGTPVMSRITVEHLTDPAREVTGAIIRAIKFASIRNDAFVRLRQRATSLATLQQLPTTSPWIRPSDVEAAQSAAAHAGRGALATGPHGGYSVEHYRHIARRYIHLVVADGRRDVLNALCEEEAVRLGQPIQKERMRSWVRKATKMGFLSPGQRGKSGRKPGPNLYKKEEDNG